MMVRRDVTETFRETFLHDGLMKPSLSTTPLMRFTGRSKREARRKLTVCSPPLQFRVEFYVNAFRAAPSTADCICSSCAAPLLWAKWPAILVHLASVQISNLRIFLWIQFLSVQLLAMLWHGLGIIYALLTGYYAVYTDW